MFIYPYNLQPIEITSQTKSNKIISPLLYQDFDTDSIYINTPASFDIETSRFYTKIDQSYLSTMYIWQVSIGGQIFYGRTWDDYKLFLTTISDFLSLSDKNRMIFYVHNLGFEFSFIKSHFNFTNSVFAESERTIYYCYDNDNHIEYRCSLKLSGGYSLENVGKKLLKKYPVEKLTGYLDYEKYRHSKTPLSSNELAYCFNDVLVVTSYIQEKIEQDGGISSIPLTNTGYVRKFFANHIFEQSPKEYRKLMRKLTLDEKQYSMSKAAFQGGFVHTNALYSGELFTSGVGSNDFKSSYPAEMVLNSRFPMELVEYHETISSLSQFEHLITKYCCIFEIRVTNLQATELYETPLPARRGKEKWHSINTTLNNGRIVSTSEYYAVMTDVDYKIMEKYYMYDSIQVTSMYCYRPDRLPTPFVEAILTFYLKKTTLDGIAESASEYMVSKNMLNASFGMAVTDIVRYTLNYTASKTFEKTLINVSNQLDNYNTKYYRFLSYLWGVWITAHCRYKLLDLISEIGLDYIYCDTDSIKYLNCQDYENLITSYNHKIKISQLQSCAYHQIPLSYYRPKNPKGKTCSIGDFEFEGYYEQFKAIRAKTYCYVKNNFFNITISGLNKKRAVPYIINKIYPNIPIKLLNEAYNNELPEAISSIKKLSIDYTPVFNLITDGLYIPSSYTGRLNSSYKDEPYTIVTKDYLGTTAISYEKSGVSLVPSDYHLGLLPDYLNYCAGLRDRYGETF